MSSRLCREPAEGRTRLLLLGGVLFVLSGCAPETPGDRRILVAAIESDPGHLNPATTTSGGTHTASELLYNGLVELDPDDLTPVPELAERWEVDDGGRRYTFHLRSDVRWHDGVPFTAHDVVYTFQEVLLPFHARTRASLGAASPEIVALDDRTVQFRFPAPYAPLLQQLNVTEAPILPRHLYQGTDPLRNPANFAPVGTGPFRFASSRPDEEIRYEANPDYFKPGLPALEGVVLRVVPDMGSQVLALEAGEVDWLFAVPGPDIARLAGLSDIRLIRSPIGPGGSNCVTTVGFNLDDARLADRRLREAVWHGLDREAFLERVLFGGGRVARAPIASGIPFAHHGGLELPEHDPEEARRILESMGWEAAPSGVREARGVAEVEDGSRLSLRFHHFPSQSAYAELLRAQLSRVGIEIRLVTLEPSVFVEVVFRERDFDTAIVSYCNGTDPEIGVRRQYDSAMIGPVPFSNTAGYRDLRVDSLFQEAGTTVDLQERGRLYRQIQEIVSNDLPYVWLVESLNARAHHVRCAGFGPSGHFAETARCEE